MGLDEILSNRKILLSGGKTFYLVSKEGPGCYMLYGEGDKAYPHTDLSALLAQLVLLLEEECEMELV